MPSPEKRGLTGNDPSSDVRIACGLCLTYLRVRCHCQSISCPKKNIRPEEEKESVRNKVFPRPEPEPAGITHVMTPFSNSQVSIWTRISIGPATTCSDDTTGKGNFQPWFSLGLFHTFVLGSSCLQLQDENPGSTTLRKIYLLIGTTYIVLMFYGVFVLCKLLLSIFSSFN
jgi:hypothetical protein